MNKNYLKNQCKNCGKVHYLKPSTSSFNSWYGSCPDCMAEYIATGSKSNAKVTTTRLGDNK